jgi:hypothetical protein
MVKKICERCYVKRYHSDGKKWLSDDWKNKTLDCMPNLEGKLSYKFSSLPPDCPYVLEHTVNA